MFYQFIPYSESYPNGIICAKKSPGHKDVHWHIILRAFFLCRKLGTTLEGTNWQVKINYNFIAQKDFGMSFSNFPMHICFKNSCSMLFPLSHIFWAFSSSFVLMYENSNLSWNWPFLHLDSRTLLGKTIIKLPGLTLNSRSWPSN